MQGRWQLRPRGLVARVPAGDLLQRHRPLPGQQGQRQPGLPRQLHLGRHGGVPVRRVQVRDGGLGAAGRLRHVLRPGG